VERFAIVTSLLIVITRIVLPITSVHVARVFIAVVHVAVGSMPLALDMNSILDLAVPWKEPFCRVLFCRKEMNRSRFVC
jgi:hypothetical protein